MARQVGLGFAYAYAYRLQSQSDVHATPVAIDNAFDRTDEGLVVRAVPQFALQDFDSYAVGAHLLLDILRPLAERIPELGWKDTTDMVAGILNEIVKADPGSTRS